MNIDQPMTPRRQFLQRGAALAFTPALLRATPADAVRTAMVGVGNRGSYLLRGVLEQESAKVLALCDIKPDRLDKAATAAGRDNPATYNDWRKIIDRQDIDAVFVATPPHLHAEMAIAALQAGKHVYCEKPVGIRPQQVRAVVAAARAAKTVFVAGQQLRSMQVFSESIRKIHDGVIGDIVMVKAQRHATADLPHDGTSGDWYFDVAKSGGYLIEQSVHNLDLCNWAIGAHPTRASGLGASLFYQNEPPGRTIYDSGSINYAYPKGVNLSFTQNVFHPKTLPAGGQFIYVYGTKGAVDLMGGATMHPVDGSAPVVLAEKPPQENPHAHIVAFYECIRNGGPNPSDITIGATAALTAILGHEAMSTGKVVAWGDLGVDV